MQFEAVYRQYASHVYRFALWLCGNPALAEDVTSETFVRAWTTLDETRGSSVKSYLLTIARHLVWKWGARSAREEKITVDVDAREPRPDDQLAVSAELRRVLAELRDVPPLDRAALVLRVEEGLSYQEIAAILDLTVSAAKVKVHRTRLRLALTREGEPARAVGRDERLTKVK